MYLAQVDPWLKYDTGYPDKTLVMTGDAFQRMYNFLSLSPVIVFDFEGSGLRWFQHSEACGIALAGFDPARPLEVRNFYVPFRHRTGEAQLDLAAIHPAIKALLEHPGKLKIAHNATFDIHMARREGWDVKGPFYDTMIAAHLMDENRRVGLKMLAGSDLGRPEAKLHEKRLDAELIRQAKACLMSKAAFRDRYGYSTINIPLCGTYACFDVDFTYALYALYESKGLSSKYPRIWSTEMSLVEALSDMEEFGMPVDVGYLQNLKETLGDRQNVLMEQITGELGRDINLNADDEVRHMLRQFGCQLTELTNSGRVAKYKSKPIKESHYSVDKDVLSEFSKHIPVLSKVMEWRDAEKLKSTYTDSLLDRLDDANLVHPNFRQIGARTGRLASSEPNFQNQPSDSNDRAVAHSGKKLSEGGVDPWSIRRAFINRGKEWVRLYYDYSQVELRVLAYYTQDPVMTDAYLKGEDIHSRTSMDIFGSTAKEFRRLAKVAAFGISYGLSPIGFSRQLGTSVQEAEDFYKKFYTQYAGIDRFRRVFWEHITKQGGYFQNLFGRPRRITDILSTDGRTRGSAERRSFGSLIQGTAAELTKESIVRLWRFYKEQGLPAYLVSTVHDEIQIDCHREVVDVVGVNTKRIMQEFPEFAPIPIVVDGEYTITNWAEKKEF